MGADLLGEDAISDDISSGAGAVAAGGIAATIAPLIDDPVADAMAGEGDDLGSDGVDSAADLAGYDTSFDALAGTGGGADDDDGAGAEEDEGAIAEPFDLTGMQAGDDMGEMGDDVDEIIDPLAGLRGEQDDDFGVQDDLLADADRLAARNQPVESGASSNPGEDTAAPAQPATPAPIPSAYTGGAPSGGSTLFERMANLSRSSGSDDDDDDPDGDGDGSDAPALSIPRFLGRQNNQ